MHTLYYYVLTVPIWLSPFATTAAFKVQNLVAIECSDRAIVISCCYTVRMKLTHARITLHFTL